MGWILVVATLATLTRASAGEVSRPEPPALPIRLDILHARPAGRTIAVRSGGDLQAALDAAQPGDVITLEAGATFRGNFILRRKSGSGWIQVRSSAETERPRPGTRVTPASRRAMPRLVTPNEGAVVQTAPGARGYHFIGIEFTLGENVEVIRQIVSFGGLQSSLADTPSDLVLDRCYVHANPATNVFRGVLLNSMRSAVVDSHISDIHVAGHDSQAILGYNGPGPFKIVNNYLEAAGENIMFGGGDPRIPGLVPSDIEIRRNHLVKPFAWGQGTAAGRWTIKNLLELKNAQRGVIEGNILENMWAEGQGTAAIVLTPRSDGAAPWSVVQDVMIRNNIVRNAWSGIVGQSTDNGHPTRPMRRVAVVNNLWLSIDRLFVTMAVPGAAIEDFVIDHNTAIPTRYFAYDVDASGAPAMVRFQYTNNVTGFGVFGVKFPRTRAAVARWTPRAVIGGNALVDLGRTAAAAAEEAPWPFDAREYAVFPDAAAAGLRADGTISDRSPLRGRGLHGEDPGVDFATLRKAIAAGSAGIEAIR